jgi:hypothetical protein
MYSNVSSILGPLDYKLSNSSETLFFKNQEGEMVKVITYETGEPWPLGVDGMGRSMEFDGLPASENDPTAWFPGCVAGSPGEAYFTCDSFIVVNEINYTSSLTSDAGDWFELKSFTSNPVDLSGWTITDENAAVNYIVPAGTTIYPDSTLVFARDMTLFQTIHPNVVNVVGPTGVALGGTDVVRLYDNTGILQISVAYSNSLTWPQEPNGAGTTLELLSASGIMNEADNWFSGCPNGSPGRDFLPGCGAGIDEMELSSFIVAPNPGTDIISVISNQNGVIEFVDLSGKILISQNKTNEKETIDVSNLKAGMYLVRLNGTVEQFVKM